MSAETVDTQIPVSSEMRDRLRGVKRGGERYEDVLTRLLDEYGASVGHTADASSEASSQRGE